MWQIELGDAENGPIRNYLCVCKFVNAQWSLRSPLDDWVLSLVKIHCECVRKLKYS